uniref:Secreted protein n=1 Tax=Macrostomum lignano TaxID=282301 RepID=A0A1I8FI40_9PLAT
MALADAPCCCALNCLVNCRASALRCFSCAFFSAACSWVYSEFSVFSPTRRRCDHRSQQLVLLSCPMSDLQFVFGPGPESPAGRGPRSPGRWTGDRPELGRYALLAASPSNLLVRGGVLSQRLREQFCRRRQRIGAWSTRRAKTPDTPSECSLARAMRCLARRDTSSCQVTVA